MFTGLIEAVGRVAAVDKAPAGRRLRVETALAAELRPGDSIATSGVCLTVTAADEGGFWADVSPETLRVTSLGSATPGRWSTSNARCGPTRALAAISCWATWTPSAGWSRPPGRATRTGWK